ncbi:MAG: GNAT family N-acetyltransferase [Solobacterium sp.]|nr:GNAT family N-acetyltransferase [Solobacterium sp.]
MFEPGFKLEEDQLILRFADDADAPFAVDLFEYPLSKEQVQTAIQRFRSLYTAKESIVLGIYAAGILTGIIEAYRFFGNHCEIGYRIKPAYRRRGFATKAVAMMTAYLCEQGYDCIIAKIADDNDASRRVLLANGYHEVNPGRFEFRKLED